MRPRGQTPRMLVRPFHAVPERRVASMRPRGQTPRMPAPRTPKSGTDPRLQ